jgi:radical SAM protein with 4Fe4S-binding SPASM domain
MGDRLGCRTSFDPIVNARRDGDRTPTSLRADVEALAQALAHPRLIGTARVDAAPRHGDEIPCALGRRTLRIAPNGDVHPCPTYPIPAGNLRERSLRDIWAGGPLLDRLRATRVRDLHGDCAGCSQSGFCNRCAAMALIEEGDLLGPYREACRVADAKARAAGLPSQPARAIDSRRGGRLHLPIAS